MHFTNQAHLQLQARIYTLYSLSETVVDYWSTRNNSFFRLQAWSYTQFWFKIASDFSAGKFSANHL